VEEDGRKERNMGGQAARKKQIGYEENQQEFGHTALDK